MTLQKNAIHITADGRRLLVMHGHELDTVVQNLGWLAHVGDIGFTLLMRCNGLVNFSQPRPPDSAMVAQRLCKGRG